MNVQETRDMFNVHQYALSVIARNSFWGALISRAIGPASGRDRGGTATFQFDSFWCNRIARHMTIWLLGPILLARLCCVTFGKLQGKETTNPPPTHTLPCRHVNKSGCEWAAYLRPASSCRSCSLCGAVGVWSSRIPTWWPLPLQRRCRCLGETSQRRETGELSRARRWWDRSIAL